MRRVPIVLLTASVGALAQGMMDADRLGPALKDFEPHKENPLACEVTPLRPALNFSFRYQAGYVFRFPASQFEGKGHRLATLVRITPDIPGAAPSYLGARFRLPEIPPTKQQFDLGGAYLLGEGRYQATLKAFDERGRRCVKQWKIEVKRKREERNIKLAMEAGAVSDLAGRGATANHLDADDAPPVRLTVLLHAAPVVPLRTRLGGRDKVMLLGTLSALLQRIPASNVRLIVFNLDQQRELFRRDHFKLESLWDVSQAVNQLELGLVDYRLLQNRTGHLDLLADLVNSELTAAERSEIVVFLGPEARYSQKMPAENLEAAAGEAPRFFYLQYRPFFQRIGSIPDSITSTVSRLRGKSVVIHSPAEFAKAIGQLERR